MNDTTAAPSRLTTRMTRALFTALFLAAMALVAILSQRHSYTVDWTDSGRNTVSRASADLLARMPGVIRIRAFASTDDTLREAVRQLVERYRREHGEIGLEFVDPQREPRLAQRYGVRRDGELVVEYAEATRRVSALSERALSNALAQLARQEAGWVVWLDDPQARALGGQDREDLGAFASHLEAQGVQMQPLSAKAASSIPDNVSLLVVPPQTEPWPETTSQGVAAFIERGGNLLWLADHDGEVPGGLATLLGVRPEAGLLVDPASRLNGQTTPEFIVVDGFASHPVTQDLAPFVAFPTATSLAWEAPAGWRARGIAASGLRSWRETGDLTRAVRFDADEDSPGPLDLAVALEREHPAGAGQQRILVFGDADFLSNAYLGLGANRDLGSNAVSWLGDAEHLIAIPPLQAADLDYAPGQAARAVIALGAPVILPLLLLVTGWLRWRRRNAA